MKKILTAVALATLLATPVFAQGTFEDKTITYIIATNPGGNYDAYGRLIGRYLQQELGAKKVVIKNLPGAGHIIGANTLAASEPDGFTIGTFNTGLIYAQIMQRDGIQFDLSKLSWIGKAASDSRAIILSNNSGFKSFDDLLNTPKTVNFAASGVGSANYNETIMLTDAFELNVKMIPGYQGNEGEMAMLRSEVVGQVGSYGSLKPFIDANNGFLAVAIGGELQPQAIDFAKTDKAVSIVNLIDAMSSLGRLTAAPAGVPEDILNELRDGYIAVMENPDFLAEAEKIGLPIEPARGDVVAEMVAAALKQSPETLAIIASALDVEIPTVKTQSPILSLEDKNKIIQFNSGDEVITAKISGSRTAVTLNGAEADRKDLEVGMDCAIDYNPNADNNEPVSIACTN